MHLYGGSRCINIDYGDYKEECHFRSLFFCQLNVFLLFGGDCLQRELTERERERERE